MECRFRYPDGQRCRCRATDAHVFCRHHAPQPRVPTLRTRSVPFHRWIDLRRALPTLDRAEIPPAILDVLSLLLHDDPRRITDRNAGMLLRALVRRHASVPFTLPGDPAPQPDPAWALSQSMDRLAAIIRRRRASTALPQTGLANQLSTLRSPVQYVRSQPLPNSRRISNHPARTPSGGRGACMTDR